MKNTFLPGSFLLLALLSPCRAAEPLYAGKPLTFWLDGLKSDDPLIREESILVLTDAGPAARMATPRLEALLKDEQRGVRIRAALALWRIAEQTKPALAELTEALRDPALDNRAEMLRKLGELGSAAGISAAVVLPYLQDANPVVRMQATQAMQCFGATAVPAILSVLEDANPRVRRTALDALGLLGPTAKEAVPKSTAFLEGDDAESRLEALTALQRIGSPASSATSAILKLTHDSDARLRAASLAALEQVFAARQVARRAASNALEDDDPLVRCRAVRLLYRVEPKHPDILPHVLDLLKQPIGRTELLTVVIQMGPWAARAVPTLTKLLSEADAPSRRLAIQALQQIGTAARPAVPALLEQLRSPEYATRQAVVHALQAIGGDSERIVSAVLEIAKQDLTTRSICLPLLAAQGPKASASVPWLVEGLRRQPLSYVTVQTAETLYKIDPERARKEAVPVLRKMMVPDGAWRVYAAMALWRLQPNSDEALKTLIECVTSNNPNDRQQACQFLQMFGKSANAAVPALRQALKDASPANRVSAAIALWKINGDTEATVPVFLEALKPSADNFTYVRYQAAAALGEMGPAVKFAALPVLRKYRDDPQAAVRSGVQQAIERIERIREGFKSTITTIANGDRANEDHQA